MEEIEQEKGKKSVIGFNCLANSRVAAGPPNSATDKYNFSKLLSCINSRSQIRSANSVRTQIHKIYIHTYICNGAEWSNDKTQAAESIKWRPQQAEAAISFYLFSRRQFSAHTQNPHAHA